VTEVFFRKAVAVVVVVVVAVAVVVTSLKKMSAETFFPKQCEKLYQ
jgi:hypothetical protein